MEPWPLAVDRKARMCVPIPTFQRFTHTSFEPLYTDDAVVKSALETMRLKLEQNEQEITRFRDADRELSGEIEMMSDSLEGVQ